MEQDGEEEKEERESGKREEKPDLVLLGLFICAGQHSEASRSPGNWHGDNRIIPVSNWKVVDIKANIHLTLLS